MNSPNELSFLPDDYLERKVQRRTNVICAVLFLVVAVTICSAFMVTERTRRADEQKSAEVERQYTQAAKQIEQVQQMQDKQRTMARQAELTASLLEKVPRSRLLADITNNLPANTSLLDLTLESKTRANPAAAAAKKDAKKAELRSAGNKAAAPVATPQPKVLDVMLKLTGIAATDVQVSQFMSKLQDSTFLKDVNLVITEVYEQDGEKLRKFQIEAALNPEADVQALDNKSTQTAAVELQAR